MVTPTCTYGSPLPYMEQVLYGPPTCTYGPPHMKCLHILFDSYGPHTLYVIDIVWSPHMYVWSTLMYVWSGPMYNMMSMSLSHVDVVPHMYDMMSMTYGPTIPYGIGIIWSAPHV